ncbi:MAG: alpha/beta hydrolase fold domain-containing protein [Phycisphaeraceae bacterium]
MPRTLILTLTALTLLTMSLVAVAHNPATHTTETLLTDILYRTEANLDDDQTQRCRLDIAHPNDRTGFATLVWFHGGGLTSGNRYIPKELRDKGIAIVAPNYRLSPNVKAPVYIEDAAAAVAWTLNNIEDLGGDPDLVFVSGHSAGGYLASMIGLDKRWLAAHDLDANQLAGLAPLSGHTITHFTVRAERGIPGTQPIIDDLAPLYHVRSDAPPLLLITGDRERELLGRYEETAYLWRMMKLVGHQDTTLFEIDGTNHGEMVPPSYPLILRFMRERTPSP